jgi:mRNA-degrading endonuclease RelE of RelBE toxin-antitoxin system
MQFHIADTFTDSLARLTNEEQKAVKTTAFDLQMNPVNPGMQLHKIDRARDNRFWSARVSRDIRLILHRTDASMLLCYVGHHDDAYRWAESRRLETHPKTGAAQLVEIRETVRQIEIPQVSASRAPEPRQQPLFAGRSDEELLGYGVPVEWLPDVRTADEDRLLELADHLPGEAAEALLELATGGQPVPARAAPGASAFEHPDAQRRFRAVANVEELQRALEFPWDKWTIFLHPAQREVVERDYNGPAKVAGSAGTGKTIVALHRAVHLARRHDSARVLLTTFSEPLAHALRIRLRRLISNEPRLGERIDVHAIDEMAIRLYERQFGRPELATRVAIADFVQKAAVGGAEHSFSPAFLLSEWSDVVDAWQIDTWEAYRDVRRLGRKTRLRESQREKLWAIFSAVREQLAAAGLQTRAQLYARLAVQMADRRHPPYDYIVVDEAQDLSVPQLRWLAAMGADIPNRLFFAGDLGQRIFQQPFSWRALGVDVRGRSRVLHINYRTSHQIRQRADRLLGPELADVDGNVEERKGTVSVFNGAPPEVQVCASIAEEADKVAAWLKHRSEEGVLPHELAVVVRSSAEVERAQAAVARTGLVARVLDAQTEAAGGAVSIATMHLAKGLEFRAIVVMACDDEVIPQQARIEGVAEDADLEEVYNTERHLLYVACTRARDFLLVTGVAPASEFLDDLTQ